MSGESALDGLGAFLGHFHPVWVHLPIGILFLLCFLEAVGLAARSRHLSWLPTLSERQRTLVLATAAAAAVIASILGWLLSRGGDYDPALVGRHQSLGIATACATLLLLAVHRLRWLYAPALVLSLLLLTATADAGARITHGTTYLTAHMPPAIGRILGISAAAGPKKPQALSLDRAVAYSDVVQPILRERCVGCHGPAKSNGDLRLDTWDLLVKGGKHGSVVKAGDLAASAIVRRIGLPADEKEHMPPRGKPQLVDDDVTLIEWWVGAGAPRDKVVAAMDLTPSVEEILAVRLGGGAAESPPDRAAVLARAALIAGRLGVLIRPLSADGPWVDVNARPAGAAFGDRELAQLAPIAAAVQWLDLGGTSVTDSGLAALGSMHRLERLHLDQTKVGDNGLARLSGLRQIVYLNLRATQVTDKGLTTLRALPRLRSLYLWQTAVTPAAAQALGETLVDRRRIARWTAQEAELERRVQAEKFNFNTGESLSAPVKPLTDAAAPKPTTLPQPDPK
jgi:uncharacterized membrane protein/mono/diheme cytochrome c family protein